MIMRIELEISRQGAASRASQRALSLLPQASVAVEKRSSQIISHKTQQTEKAG